jgi:hypothetical protein
MMKRAEGKSRQQWKRTKVSKRDDLLVLVLLFLTVFLFALGFSSQMSHIHFQGLSRKRTKKGKMSARSRLKDKYNKVCFYLPSFFLIFLLLTLQAVKKRASSVQKVRDKSKPYQGETTGIRTHTVKSKQLK